MALETIANVTHTVATHAVFTGVLGIGGYLIGSEKFSSPKAPTVLALSGVLVGAVAGPHLLGPDAAQYLGDATNKGAFLFGLVGSSIGGLISGGIAGDSGSGGDRMPGADIYFSAIAGGAIASLGYATLQYLAR